MITEPSWGHSRESVAAWCKEPFDWADAPVLGTGDAYTILKAAGLPLEDTDTNGDTSGYLAYLAHELDFALTELEDIGENEAANRDELTSAAEDALDNFYNALRGQLRGTS